MKGGINAVAKYEEDVIAYMEVMQPVYSMAEELEKSWDNIDSRFPLLRKIYKALDHVISNGNRTDPYFVDWLKLFTPIERHVWEMIGITGGNFYPQYPALNYFIDFADPIKRIGIEVDGKDWHREDKDAKRDANLFKHDWRIFRIAGSEAVREEIDFELLEGMEKGHKDAILFDWLMQSGDGVISAIGHRYYGRTMSCVSDEDINCTLKKHTYQPWS